MMVLDFIKEHSNWRELLSNEPYSLVIKEKDGYCLLKYNQLESDMSLPLVQMCRGIIVDLENMKVACRRFDKFFNHGEVNAAHLEGKIRAEEKVDGSIIGLWCGRDGQWNISTNGMIDASDADVFIPTDGARTYKDLFELAWEKAGIDFQALDKEYTYIFELVSPLNRIVVPYKETELYFLGMRHNETGQEVSPIDTDFGKYFKVPRIYPIDTLEQAIEVAQTLSGSEEGFVLVDENFNRVKVKGAEYLQLHLLRNNDLSLRSFLATVLEGKQDDLLGYFPEYEPYIRDIEDRLANYKLTVKGAIETAPWDADRKSFAMEVKDLPCSNILFKLYSNRDYNWEADVITIDNINKLIQWLGL